jgi:hypothetical protein
MKRRKHKPFAETTFLSSYFEIYTRDLKLAGSVALSTLQNTLLSRVHDPKTSSSTLMRNGGKASFVNFTQSTTFRKVNIKLHSQNLM